MSLPDFTPFNRCFKNWLGGITTIPANLLDLLREIWEPVLNPSFVGRFLGFGVIARLFRALYETALTLRFALPGRILPLANRNLIDCLLSAKVPLPKKMGQKLIKQDQAFNHVLTVLKSGGLAGINPDNRFTNDPFETDKLIDRIFKAWDEAPWYLGLSRLTRDGLANIVRVGLHSITQAGLGLGLVLIASAYTTNAWLYPNQSNKTALPQDSKRVTVTLKKGHRHRVNKRTGPDT